MTDGEISDPTFEIIKGLVDRGASVSNTSLWLRLFQEKFPRKRVEFQQLMEASFCPPWITQQYEAVMTFLFEKFRKISAGVLTDTELTLFLIWKYGDKSNLLPTLPKELLQQII